MAGDPELIDAVSRHIERRVGKVAGVFHETVSDDLHIDVHYVAAARRRPFELLVTSGMSERPMSIPEGSSECPLAELAVMLPAGWPLSTQAFGDERHYWPVRLLKQLARYPHAHGTWLGYGHSVCNDDGEPPEPYAPDTSLNAALILPPMSLPRRFFTMKGRRGRRTRFWAIVPIYWEELQLKLREGSDRLLELFDAHGVDDVVDPRRVNVASPERPAS